MHRNVQALKGFPIRQGIPLIVLRIVGKQDFDFSSCLLQVPCDDKAIATVVAGSRKDEDRLEFSTM